MASNRSKKPKFMLSLVGKYKTNMPQNEPHVTLNVLTGSDSHFIYSGTLTMTQAEWREFRAVLQRGLKDRLEIKSGVVDGWHPIPERKTRKAQSARSAA